MLHSINFYWMNERKKTLKVKRKTITTHHLWMENHVESVVLVFHSTFIITNFAMCFKTFEKFNAFRWLLANSKRMVARWQCINRVRIFFWKIEDFTNSHEMRNFKWILIKLHIFLSISGYLFFAQDRTDDRIKSFENCCILDRDRAPYTGMLDGKMEMLATFSVQPNTLSPLLCYMPLKLSAHK